MLHAISMLYRSRFLNRVFHTADQPDHIIWTSFISKRYLFSCTRLWQREASTEVHEQKRDLGPNFTGCIWNTFKKAPQKQKHTKKHHQKKKKATKKINKTILKQQPKPDPLLLLSARGTDGSAQIQPKTVVLFTMPTWSKPYSMSEMVCKNASWHRPKLCHV